MVINRFYALIYYFIIIKQQIHFPVPQLATHLNNTQLKVHQQTTKDIYLVFAQRRIVQFVQRQSYQLSETFTTKTKWKLTPLNR